MPPMPTLDLSRVGIAHLTPQTKCKLLVALCLKNGIVGQGKEREDATSKLKEAIESFQIIYEPQNNIYKAHIYIK